MKRSKGNSASVVHTFAALAVLAGCSDVDSTQFEQASVPPAVVSGPISEGSRGIPATPAIVDLAAAGYVEQEFFLEGSARAFSQQGDWSIDGKWPVQETSTADFKTRMLVRRPSDPDQFSGVVVVEWFNVTSAVDIDPDFGFLSAEILREGHAWVGVSAQAISFDSTGDGPFGAGALGLVHWDSTRYWSLFHPGDEYSYDIFSQAGAALRNTSGIRPLGKLEPQILLADGESQSAFRMLSYVNAIHPLAQVYDGFLIHSRNGTGAPVEDEVPTPAQIRTDIDVPVFQFITETDLFDLGDGEHAFPGARQPDSDRVHTWEIAGTAHADAHYLAQLSKQGMLQYDNFLDLTALLDIVNTAPQHLSMNAALHALVSWVKDGTNPPSAPAIETAAGAIVRDVYGNALGGLRLPHSEVPVATLSGEGAIPLSGSTVAFDQATLDVLYPDANSYITAITASAQSAANIGYLLDIDAQTLIALAQANPPVP